MRIVLDTGALFRPALLRELRDGEAPVVLPAVALGERIRQLRREGRDVEGFLGEVSTTMHLEAYGTTEAVVTPFLGDPVWTRHARDAMIAAHVRDGDVLCTTNPRDFLAIGLKPSQVRGV